MDATGFEELKQMEAVLIERGLLTKETLENESALIRFVYDHTPASVGYYDCVYAVRAYRDWQRNLEAVEPSQ